MYVTYDQLLLNKYFIISNIKFPYILGMKKYNNWLNTIMQFTMNITGENNYFWKRCQYFSQYFVKDFLGEYRDNWKVGLQKQNILRSSVKG